MPSDPVPHDKVDLPDRLMFWGMGGGGGGRLFEVESSKLFYWGWGGRLFEAGRLITFPT